MNLLQGETPGTAAAEVATVTTAGEGRDSNPAAPAPGIVYTHELSFESYEVHAERLALESYR